MQQQGPEQLAGQAAGHALPLLVAPRHLQLALLVLPAAHMLLQVSTAQQECQ
jgi:hypothetical protein